MAHGEHVANTKALFGTSDGGRPRSKMAQTLHVPSRPQRAAHEVKPLASTLKPGSSSRSRILRLDDNATLDALFNHSHKASDPHFHTTTLSKSSKGFSTTTCLDATGPLGERREGVDVTMLSCRSSPKRSASAVALPLFGREEKLHAEPTDSVRLPKEGQQRRMREDPSCNKKGRSVNVSTTFLTFPTELFLPSVTVRWEQTMSARSANASADGNIGGQNAARHVAFDTETQNSGSDPKLSRAETMPALHGNRLDPSSHSSGRSPATSPTASGTGPRSPMRKMHANRVSRGSSNLSLGSGKDGKKKVSTKQPRAMGEVPPMRPQNSGTVFTRRPSAVNANPTNGSWQRRASALLQGDARASLIVSNVEAQHRKTRGRRAVDVNQERELLKHVFREFDTDGDMPCDQAIPALLRLGYVEIEKGQIDTLLEQIGQKRSFLDFQDFCEFARAYGDVYTAKLKTDFEAADLDGSGSISASELVKLLYNEGISTIPGIVKEILAEITGDEAIEELTNIEQYLQLRNIIRLRGGFTARETELHHTLFARYDRDEDGRISIDELSKALIWMGCDDTAIQLGVLLQGIETHNPEELTEVEFLQVMRNHREVEFARVRALFNKLDEQQKGTITLDAVVSILQNMGYVEASAAVVSECRTDCGIDNTEDFYFDDVILFVLAYRAHEGYLWSEIAEFRAVYEQYDEDGSGGIGELELGGMLRWLGFPSTLEQRQELMAEVDIDNSGVLDFDEFLKVTRRFREQEIQALQNAFKAKSSQDGTLNLKHLRIVISTLGYPIPTKEQEAELSAQFGKDCADINESIQYIKLYRDVIREVFNQNSGFSIAELEELQKKFKSYDPTSSGYIQDREMARLLADLFPDATKDVDNRRRMQEILLSVDENQDGKLAWDEWLKLMRIVRDKEDHDRLLREQEVALEAGFTHSEVRDFRRIYQMRDIDPQVGMDFEAVKGILAAVLPVTGFKFNKQLAEIFKEVDTDSSQSLNFAEFLAMMARVKELPGVLEPGRAEAAKKQTERNQTCAF